MEKMVPPSKNQLFLLSWWLYPEFKDKKALIVDGSIRSGKTSWMSLGFIMWSIEEFNESEFIMAGKTIASLRRNVIKPLTKKLLSIGYSVQNKKNENAIIIGFGNTVNTYYLFGGKDESSQDLVQGLTACGVYFDEVALMPQSFVNQATGRALTVPNRKYWFNCNPASPFHYFKTEWIDDLKAKQAMRMTFQMTDNPVLSEQEINEAKGMYTGVFYQRYILGKWVMADGVVYSNFNKDTMVVEAPARNKCEEFFVSSDYGAQNPTTFMLWGSYQDKWYLLDEYYYDGRHSQYDKSDSEYADDLELFLSGLGKTVPIILDPSAVSFAIELEQRGFNIIPAINDVIDGIRETQTAMNDGLIMFTPNLPNVFKELGSYSWDAKAAEKGEDKVIKKFDHTLDAIRYFVMFIVDRIRDDEDEGGIKFGIR